MTPFNALVLAGSRPGGDPLALAAGVSSKALIEIGETTMLERVVAALTQAGAARIAVVSSDPAVVELAGRLGCESLPAASGPSESAAAGFRHLGAPMLLTTADHALLEPDWVRGFIAGQAPGADASVLLARREAIERDAPGNRRTYLKFADGDWSGCNLFLLSTPAAARALELWKQIEADRKRPWRIVRKLGLLLLLRYLLGRLSLADALARLGRQAGLMAEAVESPDGLAAVDVDKLDDLEFVRRLLG